MKLKQLVSEAKFAVEVEGLGTVIVDGSSEGEVRSRVSKKLKGGKDTIKGVRKITKEKAVRHLRQLVKSFHCIVTIRSSIKKHLLLKQLMMKKIVFQLGLIQVEEEKLVINLGLILMLVVRKSGPQNG